MAIDKQIRNHALAHTDSQFNFTMDSMTGKLEVPEGVPEGTTLHYVERIYFMDGTHIDQPKTFKV